MSRWWGFHTEAREPLTDSPEPPDGSRLSFYCGLSEPLLRLFAICRSELIRRDLEYNRTIRRRVEFELETIEARQDAFRLLQGHAHRHRQPENPENLLILGLLGLAPECDLSRPPSSAPPDAESLCLAHALPDQEPARKDLAPKPSEVEILDEPQVPAGPQHDPSEPAPRASEAVAPSKASATAAQDSLAPRNSSSGSDPGSRVKRRVDREAIRGLDQLRAARSRQERLRSQSPSAVSEPHHAGSA